ncbi:hypothetical protein [Ruegeria profundi]|nr:hypothetical protein [Ruegeria profundi]
MTKTIEPVFTDTEDLGFLKMTFAVHDDDLGAWFPVGPPDFRHLTYEEMTDEVIRKIINAKAKRLREDGLDAWDPLENST